MSEPPDEVRRLLDERSAARRSAEWDRADALRDRLRELGWEPEDHPHGSTARPILPATASPSGHVPPEQLESLLAEPPDVDASLQLIVEEHPDDLARFAAALAAHPPGVSWELVVVANAPSFEPEPALAMADAPAQSVLRTATRLGWADARNLGMRRSRGEVTVLIDTSLEPTGDFLAPLLACFADPTVGIAGGWGVRSGDARRFHEAPPGEVDAVEAYCLAIRREALRAVGGFDSYFRYYRNADLDLSFAVRANGWRAVRTGPLPVRRHEHRGWAEVEPEERDRLSKRNFYRFLKHWGSRRDLLLEPDEAPP